MAVAIRLYEPRDLPACRNLWQELTDVHRRLFADASIGAGEAGEQPIVVGAAHRSRGIGRALARAAVESARAAGLRQVFVRPVASTPSHASSSRSTSPTAQPGATASASRSDGFESRAPA